MEPASAGKRLAALFELSPPPSLPESGALVLYGAGAFARCALRVLQKHGHEVAALVDRAAADIGRVDGIPCHEPNSTAAAELARSGLPVQLAVFGHRSDLREVPERLRRVGYTTVIPYTALEDRYPGCLPAPYWLAPREYWHRARAALTAALDLWADDASRELFLELVALRLTGDVRRLPDPDREHQYFPLELPPPRVPIRFVDGGAYDGDTLIVAQRFDITAVAAFEPDPTNYRALCRTFAAVSERVREAALFPAGLGATTGMVGFSSGQGVASAVATDGELVPVVAFDDALPRFAPTFVKLDVEGAELEALDGMQRTLRAHQPRVAASVYHRPSHLWEVPQRLRSLLPRHSLYLRCHGHNGFDVVAYAIEP